MEMKKSFRKLLEWLKEPHGWGIAAVVLLFLGVLAATVTIIVRAPQGKGYEVFSYVLYGCSAVLLGYVVYIAVKGIRKFYLGLAEKNDFLGRMHKDFEYRTLTFAILSGLFALLVAAYYFTLFGLSFSLWFLTLATYYAVLAATRVGVLLYRRAGKGRDVTPQDVELRDARIYLVSGAMLVLLGLTFSVMLGFTVRQGFHREYAGLTIYVAALYATLKVSFAIANFVRARRRENLTVRTLRNVNIADALVSVVALQAAMLQQFPSEGAGLDSALFNTVTGGIVIAVIIFIGVYMIRMGRKRAALAAAGGSAEEDGKEGAQDGAGEE